MRKLNLKAIFWGVVAFVIFAVIAAIALMSVMILLLWLAPTTGVPEEANEKINALWSENAIYWTGSTIGLITNFVSGYVVSRVAKTDIYLNCGALIALNFLSVVAFHSEALRGFDFLTLALIIPATLFGGFMAKKKIQRIESQSEPSSRQNGNGEF